MGADANRQQSATEFACERIRSEILRMELAPGQPLSEEDLGARLKISRTPIREALSILEKEGLVRRFRNRGAVVSDISLQQVLDAYEVREHLESAAARKACSHISDKEIAAIRHAIDEMTVQPDNIDELLRNEELDQTIHMMILRAAGNRLLQELVHSTRLRTQRVMFIVPRGRYQATIDEHRRIADALQTRDPDAAEAAMRHHIRSAAARLHPLYGIETKDF